MRKAGRLSRPAIYEGGDTFVSCNAMEIFQDGKQHKETFGQRLHHGGLRDQ
jgi:hypothetical protein